MIKGQRILFLVILKFNSLNTLPISGEDFPDVALIKDYYNADMDSGSSPRSRKSHKGMQPFSSCKILAQEAAGMQLWGT